jgi:hypothetical protein
VRDFCSVLVGWRGDDGWRRSQRPTVMCGSEDTGSNGSRTLSSARCWAPPSLPARVGRGVRRRSRPGLTNLGPHFATSSKVESHPGRVQGQAAVWKRTLAWSVRAATRSGPSVARRWRSMLGSRRPGTTGTPFTTTLPHGTCGLSSEGQAGGVIARLAAQALPRNVACSTTPTQPCISPTPEYPLDSGTSAAVCPRHAVSRGGRERGACPRAWPAPWRPGWRGPPRSGRRRAAAAAASRRPKGPARRSTAPRCAG